MSVIFLGDVLSRVDGAKEIIIGEWDSGSGRVVKCVYAGTVLGINHSLMRELSFRRVEHIGVTAQCCLLIGLTDIRSY